MVVRSFCIYTVYTVGLSFNLDYYYYIYLVPKNKIRVILNILYSYESMAVKVVRDILAVKCI